jgi:ankyrin repeat protein
MEALMQAVGKGEEGTIMRLLDEDPGLLEGAGQDGHRPLTKAATHGPLKVVKLLLQRGAEVNGTGPGDATALHWAAYVGREETATFLLSKGADAHRRDTNGRVPLIVACWKGHLGVVRVLLQHMGELVLQATDDEGRTALHWAAIGGWEEMATLLLSNGAQADIRDDRGRIPLIVACRKGHVGVVRVLLQHTGAEDLEDTDKKGRTALYWAATEGHEEVVAILLENGAHVNRLGYLRRTPLMSACVRGHVGAVRTLLQHMGGAFSSFWSVARGQGLEEADGYGRTALHLAAEGDHKGVAALLLSNGAHASSRDFRGFTPLMSACEKGRVSVLQVLIEHTGSQGLEAKDNKGRTALHCAANEGHEETAAFLLDQGADATATNDYGRTPLMLACERRRLGVVRVLVQHMGEEGLEMRSHGAFAALNFAASRGHADIVALLLSKGACADVMTTHINAQTPLISACFHGHMDVVAVLVHHMGGEGLEETNVYGQTALHYAASGGHETMVAFLLSHGADAHSRDNNKTTPLMTACGRGHVGAVRVLLKLMGGQGLHDTDVKGRTALHWAVYNCHEDVVRLLLISGADPTIKDLDGLTARAFAEGARGWGPNRPTEGIAALEVSPHRCQAHTATFIPVCSRYYDQPLYQQSEVHVNTLVC